LISSPQDTPNTRGVGQNTRVKPSLYSTFPNFGFVA
jgi:hypothetical protein